VEDKVPLKVAKLVHYWALLIRFQYLRNMYPVEAHLTFDLPNPTRLNVGLEDFGSRSHNQEISISVLRLTKTFLHQMK